MREQTGDDEHAGRDHQRDAGVEQRDARPRREARRPRWPPRSRARAASWPRPGRARPSPRRAPAPTSRPRDPSRAPGRRTPAGTGTASRRLPTIRKQTAPRPKHPIAIRVRRPARLRSSAGSDDRPDHRERRDRQQQVQQHLGPGLADRLGEEDRAGQRHRRGTRRRPCSPPGPRRGVRTGSARRCADRGSPSRAKGTRP